MKKTFGYIAIFAAAMFVQSCSSDDVTDNIQPSKPERVSMTFESILDEGDQATTRSTINSDKKFRWNSGDKISVFDNTETKNDAFVASGEGELTAPTFSGTVADGANEFYALYPYDSNATWTYSSKIATAYVPSYQGWVSAGNASEASKLHLLGAIIDNDKLSFKNLTSIIHIQTDDGLNLNEIKLEMGGSGTIAGDCNVNLSTRTAVKAATGSSNTVIINNSAAMAAGDYYFVVLPTTERSIKVTFKNTAGQYQTVSKPLTNTSGIVAGKVIDFGNVTSSNLTSMADYNYTKVTSAPEDWTGDYTFIYDNGSKYMTFGGSNYNAKYYDSDDYGKTTISPTSVFDTTNKNITLVKKGEYYYMMHEGKYITGKDTNRPQFSNTPETGSLWTIDIDESGGVLFINANGSLSKRKFGFGDNGLIFMSTSKRFYLFRAEH